MNEIGINIFANAILVYIPSSQAPGTELNEFANAVTECRQRLSRLYQMLIGLPNHTISI